MTKSGCATERHFSKKDLRRLFELMPEGVCEMLEKVRNSTPKGSSGKPSVLERHEKVVGVSSHDMVYKNNVVDLSSEGLGSPFAGTPAKKVRNRLSSDVRDEAVALGNKLKYCTIDEEKIENPPLSPPVMINRVAANVESRPEESVENDFSVRMRKVDDLTKRNKMEESLLHLFELLKSSDLMKSEKMIVHQKIASRVSHLGWIESH